MIQINLPLLRDRFFLLNICLGNAELNTYVQVILTAGLLRAFNMPYEFPRSIVLLDFRMLLPQSSC